MKLLTALVLLLVSASISHAQIKVDSNYTILAKGIDEKLSPLPFIYGNLACITIKEKSSGKICSPASMEFTLIFQNETFHASNTTEAKKYLSRMKPKDVIIIDKIKMPADCFTPPKQIAITIM